MCAGCSFRVLLSQSDFPDKNSVRKNKFAGQTPVLFTFIGWPVGHETEKAALQITRFGLCIPSGLKLSCSIRPEFSPDAAVAFQIMRPTPKFFAVRRPKIFLAGFAAVLVND